jgi:nitrogen fixation protein FixH
MEVPVLQGWKIVVLGLGLALAGASPAWSQGHSHGHSHKGGQEQKIGAYEAELVVKGKEISLYINDKNDKPVDAKAFKASAEVLAKDGKKTVELLPVGGNRLTANYDFAVEGKVRATVTLAQSGAEIGKGRYNLDVGK